jgi:mono/diheme cytochrome c family protein
VRLIPFALFLFACGGADDASRVDDILSLDGDAVAGADVYQAECSGCHGSDGEGGSGPALDGVYDAYAPAQLVTLILEGEGGMPAHDYLSDQEIADLMAHVEATW